MENNDTLRRRQTRMTHLQVGEMNGTLPPQAIELEKSVLGAMMLSQDALFGHIYDLHEDLFYKEEHRTIFAAIRTLVNGSHDVDLLTVVEELRREGKLEQAGGAFYVSMLTNDVVSSAHIEYHLQILTEKYMQREVIRASTESIKEAYDETCDAVQLLDDAQKKLMAVSELSFKRESQSMDSLMKAAEQKLLSDKTDEDQSVQSGFIELDRYTSGFQPGTLIILAARPAMGKTACGLTMARNVAVDFKKPVAYFSLEMTGEELSARLLASEACIPATKLKKSGKLEPHEKEKLKEKIMLLANAPLYIDDTAGLDIFQLRAKCRRLKQRYDIQMVFIDYLQLMTASGDANKNRNREQEISNISRQLKEMSKELNIPVLAMAQLSRKVEERPLQIPMLSDLRESGSIEQDADIVLALRRPYKCGEEQDEHGDSTENLAELRILKHRSGDIGIAKLQFEGRYVRFSNFPIAAPPSIIVESKMNKDIAPNTGFDSQKQDVQYDNDGNPIFPNGGQPPIDDTTPQAVMPPVGQQQMPHPLPPDDDLPWA